MRTTKPTTASSRNVPAPTFTADDLVTALAEAMRTPVGDGGSTVVELSEAMRLSVVRVQALLKTLATQGRLLPGRGKRVSIDGALRPVPVYRIQP